MQANVGEINARSPGPLWAVVMLNDCLGLWGPLQPFAPSPSLEPKAPDWSADPKAPLPAAERLLAVDKAGRTG
jgi:hypothetical protein